MIDDFFIPSAGWRFCFPGGLAFPPAGGFVFPAV